MKKQRFLLITVLILNGCIILQSMAQNPVWITNSSDDTVTKLNPDGTPAGSPVDVERGPNGVAVAADGSINSEEVDDEQTREALVEEFGISEEAVEALPQDEPGEPEVALQRST